jgi:hypothetical protein
VIRLKSNFLLHFLSAIIYTTISFTILSCGGGGGDDNPEDLKKISDTPPLSISATSPDTYQWESLQLNTAVFIDRDNIHYSSIPASYVNQSVLQTANDDKTKTGDDIISFSVNAPVNVYVTHDYRITTKPAWLASWTETGETIVDEDTSRNVFMKQFMPGIVSLGENGGTDGESMYTVIVEQIGSSGGGIASPAANGDSATTTINSSVNIAALANDNGLEDTPINIAVTSNPAHGTTNVEADQSITYIPNIDYAGADQFAYTITDADFDTSSATVNIQVNCDNCADELTITLAWDANPAGEFISGYHVYAGPDTTPTVLLESLNGLTSGFDFTNPSSSYNAWNELGLQVGDTICFRIKAYNLAGASDFSEAVCTAI